MLSCIVLQDALGEVTKINLALKLEVFLVDDITASVEGSGKEVAEMATKVIKKLKEEMENKGLKISVNEKWQGRKEQDGCVVWNPGE